MEQETLNKIKKRAKLIMDVIDSKSPRLDEKICVIGSSVAGIKIYLDKLK